MKLKKLLATGLTVVMALGMLAGCGSSGKDNGASSSGSQDSVMACRPTMIPGSQK